MIPIQMQLSWKQKIFSQIFTAFLKPIWNFERFEKKDYPHSFCVSDITDSENVVRQKLKKSRFRRTFHKQHGKRFQALSKSRSQQLWLIHGSPPSQFSWKKSLLLTWKIWGLLVNTLATYEKYSFLNRVSLTIPIQMQFSRKGKIFCQFLAAFSNLAEILNVLKKNVTLIDFVFLKLRTPET